MSVLENILRIDPSKQCLDFLVQRIQSDKYRGIQISQHNRYTQKEISIILEEIYGICGKEMLQIRTTDLNKRPYNIKGEEEYAKLTNNIAKRIGRCTQDSLRKNILVDMHRMGLIHRFNTKKKALKPFENGVKKYIAISSLGIELLKSQDIFHQSLLYTRALENLMNGFGEEILQIILELDSYYINMYECMFFATFVYQTLNNHIYTRSDIVDFIKEFRLLGKGSQKYLIENVKQYCNPKNFKGDKTQKRDFHNWINETQQILHILQQMAYFEKNGERLFIRVHKDQLFDDNAKLKRSLNQKIQYFKNHNVVKTKGFELHHIVPLCFASSKTEFQVLDNWQNLVYIDAYSHAKITQNNNANVYLSFKNEAAVFSDLMGDEVCCEKDTHIKYDIQKQDSMLQYNKRLLNSKGW